MSLINLSVKHGKTIDEARARLEQTVQEVTSKFRGFVTNVDWNEDRTQVKMTGTGFTADMRIDAEAVHLSCDIPMIGKLLGSPLVTGMKSLLEKNFQKRLT